MTPLLLAAALALAPQDHDPRALARPVADALEEAGLCGALALARGGAEPVVLTFGRDVPDGRPITAEDRFCAGSVGKTFYAALALHHVLEGHLELDAPVLPLLDDERVRALPGAERWTLRHLLRHETGLPRYIEAPAFFPDLVREPGRVWRTGDQLEYVAGAEPVHPVGEGWAYSDTNYIVLALLLERLEQRSAHEAITERLLRPHGLTSTLPQTSRELPGLVQGHTKVFAPLGLPEQVLDSIGRFCVHPSFESGGGGWVSTPRDLARWARLLWSGRALEGEYLERTLETVEAPMLRGRYGLGVIERDTRAGRLLGHDGIFIGYLTAMGYFPELDLGVALQLNTDDGRAAGRPLHEVLVDLALALKE